LVIVRASLRGFIGTLKSQPATGTGSPIFVVTVEVRLKTHRINKAMLDLAVLAATAKDVTRPDG
jgi:hypothetical protein